MAKKASHKSKRMERLEAINQHFLVNYVARMQVLYGPRRLPEGHWLVYSHKHKMMHNSLRMGGDMLESDETALKTPESLPEAKEGP